MCTPCVLVHINLAAGDALINYKICVDCGAPKPLHILISLTYSLVPLMLIVTRCRDIGFLYFSTIDTDAMRCFVSLHNNTSFRSGSPLSVEYNYCNLL